MNFGVFVLLCTLGGAAGALAFRLIWLVQWFFSRRRRRAVRVARAVRAILDGR